MKKLLLTICCLVLLAGIVSALWATRATRATTQQQPPQVEVADAGLISGMTMEKLTQQSELIVTGQCLSTNSVWVDRRLVTVATVSVGETIKGSSASTLSVVVPGGIDANRRIPIAMSYPGAPTIQPQEDVFLFLKSSGDIASSYEVTGYAQGKFSIVEDDQGQKMVSRDLTKVPMKGGPGAVRGTLRVAPLTLFKDKVREYVK